MLLIGNPSEAPPRAIFEKIAITGHVIRPANLPTRLGLLKVVKKQPGCAPCCDAPSYEDHRVKTGKQTNPHPESYDTEGTTQSYLSILSSARGDDCNSSN